ncbi:MAG: TonB-dependent receptor [Rhodobacteraceae bacterium]|nr:TonB-dependent receptor [Paracoccaceae bacterium]
MRSLLSLAGSVPLAAFLPLPATAQPVLLDPIVLSANRAATEATRTGSSVSVLTGPDLEADGRPFVLEQIRDLPGVTIGQNGPPGTVSGFAIRGAPQQYVRVEIDGIEVSDMTAPQVSPSLSGLLIDDISRIEVLKGSQSALYGGQAVGGVISITTPRPTEPGIENRYILEGGSYSTFRGAYSLAGLTDKGEFALTVARYQTDGFSSAEEADGADEDDGYTTTRFSATGRIYATDQTDVFASAFWQDEDGDYDETADGRPVDAPNTFDGRNWGLRGGVEFTTEGGFGNTLAASYFDVDRTQRNAFGPFETNGARTRLEYLGTVSPSEALTLQFGADYAYETSESNFYDEQSNWIAGAFVQSNWAITDSVVLDAAARVDEHSEYGSYPTGRLTAAWLPAPDTTIRGSIGTGFRAPSNNELFDAFSGNPDFEPETSVSADIGVARRFADGRGEAGATLFWLEIDDLIEFDNATFLYFQQNGTSTSRGLEASALWQVNRFLTLSAAYTYTDAEQPNGARRDRIPRHDVAVGVAGAVAERITYDVGASFVFDFIDDSTRDGAGNVIDTAGYAEDYVVFNARLAYAITDQAEVYVRAANLFDEQYQTTRGYSTSDRAVYAGVAARF